MQHGITQCYQPPGRGDIPALQVRCAGMVYRWPSDEVAGLAASVVAAAQRRRRELVHEPPHRRRQR